MAKAAKDTQETVYDRIEKLEDEIATLRNEIDVIFKYGHKLLPIEIKSAQTFNESFLKPNDFFSVQNLSDERDRLLKLFRKMEFLILNKVVLDSKFF